MFLGFELKDFVINQKPKYRSVKRQQVHQCLMPLLIPWRNQVETSLDVTNLYKKLRGDIFSENCVMQGIGVFTIAVGSFVILRINSII